MAEALRTALIPRVPRSYANDQNSPLHIACYRGDYNEALMLILGGHDLSARNIWLETPLHQCAAQGHLDVMMLLLDASSEVNSLDFESLTPLHQAVIHGNRDASELLLCYGARVHNAECVTNTLSVLELANHVSVCRALINEAEGKVWELQHLCRLTIRKGLGVGRRRRIKELPLPRHLLNFLCSLPVGRSVELHENWERTRSTKAESVRKRVESHTPKSNRQHVDMLIATAHSSHHTT